MGFGSNTSPIGSLLLLHQAFGVGVPVVTMPSQWLAGRTTFALYRMMGLAKFDEYIPIVPEFVSQSNVDELNALYNNLERCCVANSTEVYVSMAIAIANNPSLRESLTDLITSRSEMLFQQAVAIEEWSNLLIESVAKADFPNLPRG